MTDSGFGSALRALRRARGLTQADLAGPGRSASHISLLESGRRRPSPEVVEELAERLGVDAEQLRSGRPVAVVQRARTDLSFARLCLDQGDAAEALRLVSGVLADGALAADPAADTEARLLLATAQERLGRVDEAVRGLESLRLRNREAPHEAPWLPVVVSLSRCYREAGDLAHAVDVAQQALDEAEQLGLQGLDGHAQLTATLALAHVERGDLLRASVLLDQLLQAPRPEDRPGLAAAYWNSALVAAERGQSADAERLAARAAALVAEGDDARSVARLKTTRAWILLASPAPEPERARALLQEALPVLQQYDSAGAVASAEVELGRCALLLGDPERAEELARSALERLGHDNALEIARARAVLGEAQARTGRTGAARDSLTAAADLLRGLGAGRQAAAAWRQQGDLLLRLGDPQQALAAYQRALDAAGLPSAHAVADRSPSAAGGSDDPVEAGRVGRC